MFIGYNMKYKILADMHCDRIVYFTSNISEHTEIDDNLYICFYDGELPKTPKEMTLRNCWSWKWDSVNNTLNYANQSVEKQITLFDQNKNSAKQVLVNVINKARKTVGNDHKLIMQNVEQLWEKLSDSEKKKYNDLAVSAFQKELATWIFKNQTKEYITSE